MFPVEHPDLLRKILTALELSDVKSVMDRFVIYDGMLKDWNQKINLISRNDEGHILTKHMIPSLGLSKVLDFPVGCRVMDLGAGAGFPGLPLKLVRSDLRVVLVESKRKKSWFLSKVVDVLGLEGVEVVMNRVEDLGDDAGPFDFIVSRAVTHLHRLWQWSLPLLKAQGGTLVAMKGRNADEELRHYRALGSVEDGLVWHSQAYDPFPSLYPLRGRTLIIMKRSKNLRSEYGEQGDR